MQVKINKKGNLRVKGFTRANSDVNLEYGPYTNGAGIFYTDDFNNIHDLINKFFGWAKPKKHKKEVEEKNKEKDDKDDISGLNYPLQQSITP